MNSRIAVIDDDFDFLHIIKHNLSVLGYTNIRIEDNPVKISTEFKSGEVYDLALIDMNMPELDGIALLEIIKNTSPTTECIMLTAVNDAQTAVECLKKGAYDYLVKPVTPDTLALSINRALERKRLLDIIDIKKKPNIPKLIYADTFKPITTQSQKMFSIFKEAELHAQSDVPILITGESGTGKELLAQAIHCASPRSKFKFSPVNMASISANLFESEFFGYIKGAFTGAANERSGYLEHTNGGTLFLDEIGTLPMELQGKLLRMLQDGEYIKLGANTRQKADVRFVAATNENLEKLVAQKLFRKDLYYRIRGGWLNLPPLRERTGDIPLLINRFVKKFCGSDNNCSIDEDAMSLLMTYDYPGNVRELKSIIHSTINLAQGREISYKFLPEHLRNQKIKEKNEQPDIKSIIQLSQVEKEHIIDAYKKTGKNKSSTARKLGIGLNTLRRKLKSYGVD